MTDVKVLTESCTLCAAVNCEGCCFNSEYKNKFTPNNQTQCMVHDGYLDTSKIAAIHRATLQKRMGKDADSAV